MEPAARGARALAPIHVLGDLYSPERADRVEIGAMHSEISRARISMLLDVELEPIGEDALIGLDRAHAGPARSPNPHIAAEDVARPLRGKRARDSFEPGGIGAAVRVD